MRRRWSPHSRRRWPPAGEARQRGRPVMHRVRIRRKGPQDWRGAGLALLCFLGAGLGVVGSVPLAGRLTLIAHADGYRPGALTVEAVRSGRRGGRVFAQGTLADERPATVLLPGWSHPPRTLSELEARQGRRPAVLDVMVNDALADSWMHRDRVRLFDPRLRERVTADAWKLGAMMTTGLGLALWSGGRLWRRRPAGPS